MDRTRKRSLSFAEPGILPPDHPVSQSFAGHSMPHTSHVSDFVHAEVEIPEHHVSTAGILPENGITHLISEHPGGVGIR